MDTHFFSKSRTRSVLYSLLVLLFVVLIFLYFGTALYFMHADDVRNRTWIQARTKWVQKNHTKLIVLFTEIFPSSADCFQHAQKVSPVAEENCKSPIRRLIDERLNDVLGYSFANERVIVVRSGRLPIFFVRLKDRKTLEKLYQDGTYIEEQVDTRGERMVVEMLQGVRDPFAYPQYNCCGGDDFVPEIPVFNFFLPTRIYLGDFPTETEQIYLIRDDQDKILGGLVYLYGD